MRKINPHYDKEHSASELLGHINKEEYAFFVSSVKTDVYDPKTGIQNTFENWEQGLANERVCRVVGVDKFGLDKFLQTASAVYNHFECVYAPKNGLSVIEVNKKFADSLKKTKTEAEIQKEKNEELERELLEMKKQLAELSKKQPEEKRKRRTKEEIERDNSKLK